MVSTRSGPLQSTRALETQRRDALPDGGAIRVVETVVVALIPEYHQVKVRDREGHLYALTSKTAGVALAAVSTREDLRVTVQTTVWPS